MGIVKVIILFNKYRKLNKLDVKNVSNNNVTDLLKAFLDNGLVNTFQRATREDVSQ
jgi:hypothetical protein